MTRTTVTSRVAMLIAPLLLAACGGGGGGSNGAATDFVPASASDTPAGFTQYVGSLPTSERSEPLALGALLPPTSDTTEPAEL